MKLRILGYLALCCALFAVPFASARITVTDGFGRNINDYGVTLADWQGHLMNPMVKLKLSPPSSGVRYPLNVTITATGSSRLMLNSPSTLSSNGASKTVTFNNGSTTIEVFLSIAPDRAGGYGEIERYDLSFSYSGGGNSVPIKVIDLDDDLQPKLPIKFDYRYDNINRVYNDYNIKTASEAAIKDWFYFFDYQSFDTVPAGDESLSLPGNDWQNHVQVYNETAYNGFYVFKRGIVSPYSTGYPATNGKYIKQNGRELPGQMHRSAALILHFNPGASVFSSIADNDWYRSDIRNVTDVYGLVMHEFGHSVAYHDYWNGLKNYRNNYGNARKVIDYQGVAVPLDSSAHIPADAKYWDRISGHSAGWNDTFPVRRWMLTKLTLLIAQEVGWKLRDIGPFIAPSITTNQLAGAAKGAQYSQTLKANNGGVPIYDWTIASGALPTGLSLNRFTGEISGVVSAAAGTYNFSVRLKDGDEKSQAVSKSFSITVSTDGSSGPGDPGNTSCAAPTSVTASNVTQTQATINWNNAGASSYYIYYRAAGGQWILACNGTTANSCSLTGLTPATNYEAWVSSNCPDGAKSKVVNFTTLEEGSSGGSCAAPTSVTASNVTQTQATINWNDAGASSYYIYYRAAGGQWILACNGTTANSCFLTGLAPRTNYEVWVNSNCPDGAKAKVFYFTTR